MTGEDEYGDEYGCEWCGEEDAEFEVDDSDPYTGYYSVIRIGRRCEAARRGIVIEDETPRPTSGPDDCEFCGALWNTSSLAIRRPECICGKRVCWRCPQTVCAWCGKVVHQRCAVTVGRGDDENYYCNGCAIPRLRDDLLNDLTLEELLAASVAIAKVRGDAA